MKLIEGAIDQALDNGINLRQVVTDFENMIIKRALIKSDLVVAVTARMLKIKRPTLVMKIKRRGLEVKDVK